MQCYLLTIQLVKGACLYELHGAASGKFSLNSAFLVFLVMFSDIQS